MTHSICLLFFFREKKIPMGPVIIEKYQQFYFPSLLKQYNQMSAYFAIMVATSGCFVLFIQFHSNLVNVLFKNRVLTCLFNNELHLLNVFNVSFHNSESRNKKLNLNCYPSFKVRLQGENSTKVEIIFLIAVTSFDLPACIFPNNIVGKHVQKSLERFFPDSLFY